MSWKGFAKGLLFCAGMLTGATAGHLFYLEHYLSGAATFTLTALFLFYAMADLEYSGEDESYSQDIEALRKSLAELALIVAEDAVEGAKRIGRGLPSTPAELEKLEDSLIPFLSRLQVEQQDRERVRREIDKLRTRSRQADGRRALQERR